MSIVSHFELARSFDYPLGDRAIARRTFVCTLSNDTLQGAPLNETDIFPRLGLGGFGTAHPTWSSLGLRRVMVNERFGDSPYHVEVIAEYGAVSTNDLVTPTSRAPLWDVQSMPSQIPTFYYYFGNGNNDVRPLTNSANDFFEGLVTEESIVKAVKRYNSSTFPLAQMQATNTINGSSYFGTPEHTWKCAGVTATQTIEFFNNVTYTYYATQVELTYRQTGWVLQLPDVGWNYLEGGVKKRGMVFDDKNGEWIASPNPVGLNGFGAQTLGVPAILPRRVNQVTDFFSLFGAPPG